MQSEQTSSLWHFDALDSLAGMAFVSRTDTNSDNDNVVFFCPPAFQPELVGRSSIALGATRGSFQGGLIIEGEEVGFPSLAAAGEFVRRAYVRGSAGDGGEPDAGGEPKNSGPDPQDPAREKSERPSQDPSPALTALVTDMVRFRESVAKCKFGEIHPMEWSTPPTSATNMRTRDILISGAAHIFFDIFYQRPSIPWNDLRHSIFQFGTILWTMGLRLSDLKEQLDRLYPGFHGGYLLLKIQIQLEHRWRKAPWNLYSADPLEILSQLAAPNNVTRVLRPDDLLAWLSIFLATPDDALVAMSPSEGFERATFAAAVIVNQRDAWPLWLETDDRSAAISKLENKALTWLREHLPQVAYCKAFEVALASMGRQR
ncbi:hypothetical protein H8L32_02480 [Undibacterium sp. CY18W]|uniref:Uncharacterized protein n=1 Tax=Undibacterium hunanense TaxID=2762292 RepID=A0ABR6ZLC6_9BURK|nr:hypothetical protein [Undibacterium hunanense]MBC3916343.1 hypothetical protein [Undibacterium hunanense]